MVGEKLNRNQMFRWPIEVGYPSKLEFIYCFEDGAEYKVDQSSLMPEDSEISFLLYRGKVVSRDMGPPDPKRKFGLSLRRY